MVTAPYDPTLIQDLRAEGIRYVRFGRRRWVFASLKGDDWKIHVQPCDDSRQMIRVLGFRWAETPDVRRQIFIHLPESFAWTLALARNLNGNNDKPGPTRRG